MAEERFRGQRVSASQPSSSFPDILKTGSMLKLGADLVDPVPSVIGSYRVLERIGEGGMGVVYLAEQAPPLVRRVAVKLIRSAVPGDRASARFESERQTLAVMDHPNIARVFDAGSTSDSRPYFVMEYVAGESITDHCDARRLGIEPRLELFLRVCDGVQHAHRNAVIHRDIKPSNILVTTVDGTAVPKIIDFGVAKALDTESGPASTLTQFGQIVGTPEYLSPEQAALGGGAVDTRTDVYSLGVVLYELLVGSTPFEREHRTRREPPGPLPPHSRAGTGAAERPRVAGIEPRRGAGAAAARRPRCDRHEGVGEGSGRTLRHPVRIGRRSNAPSPRSPDSGPRTGADRSIPKTGSSASDGIRGHRRALDDPRRFRDRRRCPGRSCPA